jgi:hypothetical protein
MRDRMLSLIKLAGARPSTLESPEGETYRLDPTVHGTHWPYRWLDGCPEFVKADEASVC